MIKIEKLKDGAQATISRNGVKQTVFPAMIISQEELANMDITVGTVEYSINEELLQEVSAKNTAEVKMPVKSAEPVGKTLGPAVEDSSSVKQEKVIITNKPATKIIKK